MEFGKHPSPNPLTRADADRSDEAAREWTVVVDLKLTFGESTSPQPPAGTDPPRDVVTREGLHVGSEFEAKKLRDLQDETIGKPVAIIVQSARPDPSDPRKVKLERYAIEDGKISELTGDPRRKSYSADFRTDLTGILKIASDFYPSKKTALYLTAHGGGNTGFLADSGRASLSTFADAVKAGTQKRLDLIDLVVCNMAQDGTLNQLRGLTSHLVASPTVEQGSGHSQISFENLNAVLSNLLKEPTMDGGKLAETSISETENGADMHQIEN